MRKLKFVGLDVHGETIAVAIAESGREGQVRSLGTVANRPEAIAKLFRKLGEPGDLKVCYEAGCCGYPLFWQLTKLGIDCTVIAPGLVPTKATDRVKTDRRDAEKLARCHRSGDLTAVWVPDRETEALRDLVRAREAALKDLLRAKNRIRKLLLRNAVRPPEGMKAWTLAYRDWLKRLRFPEFALEATRLDYVSEVDHLFDRLARLESLIDEAVSLAPASIREVVAALQGLRGVKKITAATLATEIGPFSRFPKPTHLMSYVGVVAREHSSGGPGGARRGGITKAGNAHLRRVLGEASFAYLRKPNVGGDLRKRQEGLDEEVKRVAWRAQHRLYKRGGRLLSRGKPTQKVVIALGRELLGFIWAIGTQVERVQQEKTLEKKTAAA